VEAMLGSQASKRAAFGPDGGTSPRKAKARLLQACGGSCQCACAAQRYQGTSAQCLSIIRQSKTAKRSEIPKAEKGRSMGISQALRDLDYPETRCLTVGQVAVAPVKDTGMRALMAQAFSAAAAQEIAALGRAWQLGEAEGERRLEEGVARALKHICRRAERSCVLKALRQPAAPASEIAGILSDEELALEARCSQLESELAASSERLSFLDTVEAKVDMLVSEWQPRSQEELLHNLSEEVANISLVQDDGAELDEGFEQSLQRLGLVSSWLNRTLCQLEEVRQELAEKEKAAASCAFLHLPGEAPNAQSALARLP